MPYGSICWFYSFFISLAQIYSGRQYCKDMIQIEILNKLNKNTKIVFQLEFSISHQLYSYILINILVQNNELRVDGVNKRFKIVYNNIGTKTILLFIFKIKKSLSIYT